MVSVDMKILFLFSLFMPLVSSQKVLYDLTKRVTSTMHVEQDVGTILEHADPEERFQELDHDLEMKLRAQIWSDTKRHKNNKKVALSETPVEEDTRPVMPNEDESHRYPPLNAELEAKLRAHIWSDTKRHKKATGTKRLRGSN